MTHTHTPTHPAAVAAIRTAQNWHRWGPFAAWRYAAKQGVPAGLVTLARVLHEAERAGLT